MRVYVAGSSHELSRVRAFCERLREAGFAVHDWMTPVSQHGSIPDNPAHAREEARNDLVAIDQCAVFVLLTPETSSKGAWVELGYALARHKPICVVGAHGSVFSYLADRRVETEEEALEWLLARRKVFEETAWEAK